MKMFFTTLGILYISFWILIGFIESGLGPQTKEWFDRSLFSFVLGVLVSIPFVLGYAAGRFTKKRVKWSEESQKKFNAGWGDGEK